MLRGNNHVLFIYLHWLQRIPGTIMEILDAEKLEIAAGMLKAMAHPMRIAILKILEGNKKLTVTEIHEILNIEQSTASHHLGILKNKGVLCSKREGKNTRYFLKDEILGKIIDSVHGCSCE